MSINDSPNFIELIPTEESRTARCPAMCQTIIGGRILAASALASNNAIHAVLDAVKGRLFDDMVVSTADGPVHTNIFNIYLGKLPRNCAGEIIRGDETYRANIKSIYQGYVTRELCNKKSPIIGDSTNFIKAIDEEFACRTTLETRTPVKFWNESVCAKIDGMVKGYAGRVAMEAKAISGHQDSKWDDAIRAALKSAGKFDMNMELAARILAKTGPQPDHWANATTPDLSRVFGKENNKMFATKVCGEPIEISPSQYYAEGNPVADGLKTLYFAAFKYFMQYVIEGFPNPTKVMPLTVPEIQIERGTRITGGYFDWEVTIVGIPGGKTKLFIRAHSDKGGTYYPDNLFAYTSDKPKGTIVFNDEVTAERLVCTDVNRAQRSLMTINIPYKLTTSRPAIVKNEDGKPNLDAIDLNKVIGMDVGIAVAGVVTTIRPEDFSTDMIDWHEAIHAYRDGHAKTNLFTKTATKSVRDDLQRMCKEYEDKSYTLVSLFSLGVRDGSPTDASHGWNPVCDPCAPFLSWMKNRKKHDGTPFYTEKQLAVIGHTKVWRKFMRQIIANRRQYFHEQSIWDKTHNPVTEVFSKLSPTAAALNDRYAKIDDKIRVESTFILAVGLLNTDTFRKAGMVTMEDLNLNDVKKAGKFRSLYATVSCEWQMGPSNGCKLSAARNGNVAIIEFSSPVTVDEVKAKCKQTAHWNVPETIAVNGCTATIYCTPTPEGMRCRESEWADDYVKKTMHAGLLKHDVERISTRRGVAFQEVSAKMTSQTCHLCGYGKCGKNDLALTREQCLSKKVNFRKGRVFVCGNPACRLHGQEQNADQNAAYCIRNLAKYKFKDFDKSLNDK